MSYPINYPTPQGADIQMFSHGGSTSDWTKPQGASFVWFTLLGAGGGGSAGSEGLANPQAGGAGAVTNFMGPAFLMPDVLRVTVGLGGGAGGTSRGVGNSGSNGGNTTIVYQQKDTTGYTLLTAGGGVGGIANSGGTASSGAVMTANYFTAMGFFQSVSSNTTATSFLSPGSAQSTSAGANYGYGVIGSGRHGWFQISPIIVGRGGASGENYPTIGGNGGVGCGGGTGPFDNGVATAGGDGGDGLVVIITW